MNGIELFNYQSKDIRVFLNTNNEPYFCASDVTGILGYSNGRDAVIKHCKPDGVAKRDIIDKMGRNQEATFISEGNLYRLIIKSGKKESEKFESWVCDEVLPTIRRTGSYSITGYKLPQTYSEALRQLAEQVEQKEMLEKQLVEAKPKVEFFEAVAGSKTALPIGDIAKILAVPGFGRNKLFKFLRDNKILDKENRPYQQYVNSGYFRVVEQKWTNKLGETNISTKTLVYQKGVDFIRKKICV